MRPLISAFLITAVVFAIAFLANGATGYAVVGPPKITGVSGYKPLNTNAFSPNGDGIADTITITASGECARTEAIRMILYKGVQNSCNIDFSKPVPILFDTTGYHNYCSSGPSVCTESLTATWNGKDANGKYVSDGLYCISIGCQSNNFPSDGTGVSVTSKLYYAKSTNNGDKCGKSVKCNPGYFLGAMKSCGTVRTDLKCNSGDTCQGSDSGSCKFDGWKCNLGNGDYCCKAVGGGGVCQQP
jgi:hypothetical protein